MRVRDYIHVSDLTGAHLAAVIKAVKKVTGAEFDVGLVNRRPGDPAALIDDIGRSLIGSIGARITVISR
jgi:UDP-glucose 4-epimerase